MWRLTGHLVINKHTYTADRLDLIPDYIKAAVGLASYKQTDNVTLFFNKHCPLSNFFQCEFTHEDHQYSSVEQYLSYRKAILFDERGLADQCLQTNDPKTQKHKVSKLKKYNFEAWNKHAAEILQPVLMSKFSQNEHLTASLLATGSTEIAEASAYDSLFGIGLSLNSPDAVVKAKWKGSNIQGAALTQVRDSIKSINATL